MKKQRTYFLFLMAAVLNLFAATLSAQKKATRKSATVQEGFLKVNGTKIIDATGQPVILRGMGFGGWLLQEGYMFRVHNIGQQYRIREKITDVVGEQKAEEFYKAWLKSFITKADIDSMAAWGFNSVRLPMHYNLFTLPVEKETVKGKQTWLKEGFTIVDSLLSWCKANHIYLILDLHAAPGGQGNDLPISDRDSSKPALWQSEANMQKTIELWKELAKHYVNEKWIGGYDIINEPNWGFDDVNDKRGTAEKSNKPLRQLMMDITKAIRTVDTNHIVIIEGNGFGNNYNGIFPAWDKQLAVSFHKYGNFNNRDAVKKFLAIRDEQNIPIWLGESGENSNTWFTECISLVEENGVGWSWWPLKKMGINNPLEIKTPEGYNELLAYWSGKGSKPTEEQAWKVLQELLQNIQLANNKIHYDVIDAMFRQVKQKTAVPFKQHIISNKTTIAAVDFDLGRQAVAYYDKDTASYQYTPGVNTVGNKGHVYRNDGVDIKSSKEGTYIFSMEDGEWLQYTVTAEQAGTYKVVLSTSAANAGSQLSVSVDGKIFIQQFNVPATANAEQFQQTAAGTITLNKGLSHLKLFVDKGGCQLLTIQLIKQ
ncbi:MAG: cellulase family glycosylhydrolase [Lacibacter sp.]